MSNNPSPNTFDAWLADDGPAAVVIRQPLRPVTGNDGVLFPPTYAGGTYNIDYIGDEARFETVQLDKPGEYKFLSEDLQMPAAFRRPTSASSTASAASPTGSSRRSRTVTWHRSCRRSRSRSTTATR